MRRVRWASGPGVTVSGQAGRRTPAAMSASKWCWIDRATVPPRSPPALSALNLTLTLTCMAAAATGRRTSGCLGSRLRRLLRSLVVQAGGDLGGVALVVELEQPVERLVLGVGADREAHALRRLPVVVVEREVAPPVGVADGVVEHDVQLAKPLDVGVVLVGIMDPVVGVGEPELGADHEVGPEPVELPPGDVDALPSRAGLRLRLRERLEYVGGRVPDASLQGRRVGDRPPPVERRCEHTEVAAVVAAAAAFVSPHKSPGHIR